MKELEKDMAMLRNGMKEVGREIEFYRTQPPVTGDRYVQGVFMGGGPTRFVLILSLP